MKNIVDIIAKLSEQIVQTEEDARSNYNFTDLTVTQMHYLEAINRLENPNITELSQELKLTKPTVTVSIDKLIEKNYIVKIQSDADRRSAHLHLTDKGKQINEMHEFAHQKLAETFVKDLTSTEISILTTLLDKVIKGF